MSSRSDVLEMQDLCGRIATHLTTSHRDKERATAVSRLLGVTWNRALEFLKAKARRVDSWEKDNAREALAKLNRAEQARKVAEHLDWLHTTIGQFEASGEELAGPHLDALKRLLRGGGAEAGAVDREGE